MIKTMKVKKKLRLDELIKYLFDNGIEDKVFPSNGGSSFDMCEVRISGSGNIKMSGYINEHTTFTVELEEEITKNTPFEWLIEVNKSGVYEEEICSISDIENENTIRIYALLDEELKLIWEAE